MKKPFLLLFLALFTACSAMPSSELGKNRQTWQDAQIDYYRYTLSLGCFCAFMEDMPLTIEVINGEMVSMTRSDGTAVDASSPNYDLYLPYSTLDRLFTAVEEEMDQADAITVTYEPLLGFPVEVAIDRIEAAVDDELYIQVSGFQEM